MPGDVDVDAAADAATAFVEEGLVVLVEALVMAMSMAGCDEEAAVSSNLTCFMCCSCS
jgi:hypothetical protein